MASDLNTMLDAFKENHSKDTQVRVFGHDVKCMFAHVEYIKRSLVATAKYQGIEVAIKDAEREITRAKKGKGKARHLASQTNGENDPRKLG